MRLPEEFPRLHTTALVIAALGLTLGLIGFATAQAQFYRAYLLAFVFWSGISIGCLGILMLAHLTGGRWASAILPILEAGSLTIWLMGLLFIPIISGREDIFRWQAHGFASDVQEEYLKAPFYVGRAVVYFLIWGSFALRFSLAKTHTNGGTLVHRHSTLSALGLIILVLTGTLASVDWLMSLDSHWFSTIYGILFITAHILSALALSALIYQWLKGRASDNKDAEQATVDLGNLLIAAVLSWAYLAFIQFLVIWSGNLPREIEWYVRRTKEGWQWLFFALFLFKFIIPFVLLLLPNLRRRPTTLPVVIGMILLGQFIDLYWNILPTYSESLSLHWLDIVLPVGMGGLWLFVSGLILRRGALTIRFEEPSTEGLVKHES